MLVKEECVHGSESRLYDSPGIPTGEVALCWARIWIASSFLWAPKTTLTSAWQGFIFPIAFMSFQTGSWYGFSFPICPIYIDSIPEADGCFVVGSVDVASVDERCDPIYLLSWLSFFRTEDI